MPRTTANEPSSWRSRCLQAAARGGARPWDLLELARVLVRGTCQPGQEPFKVRTRLERETEALAKRSKARRAMYEARGLAQLAIDQGRQ